MRIAPVLGTLALVLAACSAAEPDGSENGEIAGPVASESPIPVEPDGGIGDGAPPLDEMIVAEETGGEDMPGIIEQSFPIALRGKWRSTEDGEVTAARCDGYDADNMGKVLTIREDGYSYFETGGRFIVVKAREEGRIRAVFDTTYADEPTRDELEFRADPVARTLTVRNFDTGERTTTTYRRCPG